MSELYPLFLRLAGRAVLVVGGGPVALAKVRALEQAGAAVTVVAPELLPELSQTRAKLVRRAVEASDLDGAWLVVSAAHRDVNAVVAAAAEARRVFVVAVDDPEVGSAFGAGVVRRDGVTFAISTDGAAPALAGLLREALEAVLPFDLGRWLAVAKDLRPTWRRRGVPIEERRPELLRALNELYAHRSTEERA